MNPSLFANFKSRPAKFSHLASNKSAPIFARKASDTRNAVAFAAGRSPVDVGAERRRRLSKSIGRILRTMVSLRLLGNEDSKWKSVEVRCCRHLNPRNVTFTQSVEAA
jgi:hypothetical protein